MLTQTLYLSVSVYVSVSFSTCMCVSVLQSWSCEDPDVHQSLSVWARGGCCFFWKLLFLCGAALPPRHGEFSVLYAIVGAIWGNDKSVYVQGYTKRKQIGEEQDISRHL